MVASPSGMESNLQNCKNRRARRHASKVNYNDRANSEESQSSEYEVDEGEKLCDSKLDHVGIGKKTAKIRSEKKCKKDER